jgi:hypothetical protein
MMTKGAVRIESIVARAIEGSIGSKTEAVLAARAAIAALESASYTIVKFTTRLRIPFQFEGEGVDAEKREDVG